MNLTYLIAGGRLKDAREFNGELSEFETVEVYVEPDFSERTRLIQESFIDEHTLNSVFDPDELSRLEFEPSHAAIIFKKPKNYSTEDNFLFKVNSIGFFLFKDRLIVITPDNVPLFEGKGFNTVTDVKDVMLKIISKIIYHFVGHLKTVNLISEQLENKINASLENRYLINLFSLEKSLVYYLNAINSNSGVFEMVSKNRSKLKFSDDNLELLENLFIENNQCYKQAEIYSNILASMMDARASIVNNNLNQLMKTLNIITIVIMVPTFIVSLFSMNVPIPLQNSKIAFPIVGALSILSSFIFLYFWNRKRR